MEIPGVFVCEVPPDTQIVLTRVTNLWCSQLTVSSPEYDTSPRHCGVQRAIENLKLTQECVPAELTNVQYFNHALKGTWKGERWASLLHRNGPKLGT